MFIREHSERKPFFFFTTKQAVVYLKFSIEMKLFPGSKEMMDGYVLIYALLSINIYARRLHTLSSRPFVSIGNRKAKTAATAVADI